MKITITLTPTEEVVLQAVASQHSNTPEEQLLKVVVEYLAAQRVTLERKDAEQALSAFRAAPLQDQLEVRRLLKLSK